MAAGERHGIGRLADTALSVVRDSLSPSLKGVLTSRGLGILVARKPEEMRLSDRKDKHYKEGLGPRSPNGVRVMTRPSSRGQEWGISSKLKTSVN